MIYTKGYSLGVPEQPRKAAPQPDQATPMARWLASVIPAVYKSDAALAREIGVDRSLVGKWRRGMVPSAPALVKLANATGTSLETLIRIAGYQPYQPEKDAGP